MFPEAATAFVARWSKASLCKVLIASGLFAGSQARGTMVAFYSDGSEIFVACDGKVANKGNVGAGFSTNAPQISRIEDVVIGYAGIKNDIASEFDITVVAEKALSKG